MTEKFFLGLDLGCSRAKAVAVDHAGTPVVRLARATGLSFEAAADDLREAVTAELPRGARLAGTVTTGTGRRRAAPSELRRTGISCHARAAHLQLAGELDVVDLGARGSTVVRVDAGGTVRHFLQQRRCAAGTGTFLNEVARRLALSPEQLGALAAEGAPGSRFRQTCPLFIAEEAEDRARDGDPLADLCRAALAAVVDHLLDQGPLGEFVVLVGGLPEQFPLLASLLTGAAGVRVEIPPHPGSFGALGAALIARDTAAG